METQLYYIILNDFPGALQGDAAGIITCAREFIHESLLQVDFSEPESGDGKGDGNS